MKIDKFLKLSCISFVYKNAIYLHLENVGGRGARGINRGLGNFFKVVGKAKNYFTGSKKWVGKCPLSIKTPTPLQMKVSPNVFNLMLNWNNFFLNRGSSKFPSLPSKVNFIFNKISKEDKAILLCTFLIEGSYNLNMLG